jgi:hypothetical protein
MLLHACAVAQGNVVRAMSVSHGKSLEFSLLVTLICRRLNISVVNNFSEVIIIFSYKNRTLDNAKIFCNRARCTLAVKQ